jgi:hypothetical protein
MLEGWGEILLFSMCSGIAYFTPDAHSLASFQAIILNQLQMSQQANNHMVKIHV